MLSIINNLIGWSFGALGWLLERFTDFDNQIQNKTPYERCMEFTKEDDVA